MTRGPDRRSASEFDGGDRDIIEPPAGAVSESDAAAPDGFAARLSRIETARRSAATRWWSEASPNLRGSVMMIGAFALMAVMLTCIKLVGDRIAISQILVVRQTVMMTVIFALAGRDLPRLVRTDRPALQLARGLFSLGAMCCGFTAIVHMPMAEATAIGFSQVLFVTLAAIVILHEVVDGRRWIAMAAGFCGVLIMLKPSGGVMNAYALLAIVGAMFGAGITITVRILGDRENTTTILIWQGIVVLAALVAPSWSAWISPTPGEWVLMIALGLVGLGGQWLITRAYQIGEASALAPLDFVRLLLATLSGYLIFSEVPDIATVIGAALVVGGTFYTMRRNALRKAVARSID